MRDLKGEYTHMIRAISISAYRQYRNGARQHLNMDYDVLKVRLSSLIESVDSCNISYSTRGMKYRFGNCVFHVDFCNCIKGISWSTDDLKPSYNEVKRLESNYKKYGLNRSGTKFVNIN